MGALLLGYDSGIAGAVIPLRAFKYDMGIDGTKVAVATVNSNVVSILFGGAFFGAIFTSWASYYLGRRAAMMYSMVLFMLGGALQTAAKDLKWIYGGRFVSGLAVGATSLVAPYYIAEISPTQHRARTVGAFQAFLVAGSLLAYWVTYGCDLQFHPTTTIINPPSGTNTTGTTDPGAPADPTGSKSHLEFHSAQWRVPMAFQLLPGVIFSVLMVGVKESPRWLAGRGRKEEAIRVLAWLRNVKMNKEGSSEEGDSGSDKSSDVAADSNGVKNGGEQTPHSAISTLSRDNNTTNAPHIPRLTRSEEIAAIHAEYAGIQAQIDETRGASIHELFSRANGKRFVTSTYIAIFHIWTFHTGILYYAPTVFKAIGFSDTRSALLASGVFGVCKFVATVAALAFTVNRYGRVTGMSVGTFAHAILFFILGAILKTRPPHGGPIQPASIAMMALLYLYVIIYSFGMGPLPWVYSSEIYPLRIRELGQMWFTALTWACNFATSKVTPVLFVKLEWRTWMLFGALNLAGSIMCWLICPETRGLSMEEIDILFGAVSAEQRAADIERVLHGPGDGKDNSSDKQYQDSVYSSYSGEREEPTAEPEPITKAQYEQLRCSLGDRPRLEPPNFRSDAREKLARLTRVQFLELAMDVHDETAREKNRNPGDLSACSTIPVRRDYTSHRNEARQKIANLRSDLLQELMSDIFYELGRRYPKFKEAGSPSEKVSLFQYTSGPVESELAGSRRLSRIVGEHKTLEDDIGRIVRSMTLELNGPSMDIISSSMSITEIISILGQHGCADITDALDVGRCGLGPVAGGGFGDVYQGYLRTGVEVAIKCPRFFVNRVEISRADLKAAARELHAWSKYDHPNVVELLGVALFRDRIAMISPWMKNGTLCQYILRHPNADKYCLCSEVASGVAYLHSMGTVHGDIKGLNVLVSQDGNAKLIDFGNSRLKNSTLHFTGSHTASTFSTRWTAPELLNGSDAYTPEADVYALGMTILEVISGQLPFSNLSNDPAVITRVVVRRQYPERPSDSFPPTPDGDALWELLTQCWSFDPSARPRASEVQTQVRNIGYEGLSAVSPPKHIGGLVPMVTSAAGKRLK
ncbi:hypothetical protein FRC07_010822 [Ceratobasidium sp. 392]|nr:hypothetical protein FRC07_010822 [Ceratobasidium sp. 392]